MTIELTDDETAYVRLALAVALIIHERYADSGELFVDNPDVMAVIGQAERAAKYERGLRGVLDKFNRLKDA